MVGAGRKSDLFPQHAVAAVPERSYLLTGALLLAHLAVTLPLAFLLNIGHDESYTLESTAHGPATALTRALGFEMQPPLYFVLLSLWRLPVVDDVFLARLFSVLCVALMLPLSAAISRRCFDRLSPAWLTGLIAFNPFVIWAAVEMRLYAMALLLAALLILLFLDGWQADEVTGSSRSRWLFCITALVGLYTHYYLGFLLAGLAAGLLVQRRWKPLVSYASSMAALGLAFVPMLLIIRWQISEQAVPLIPPASLSAGLRWMIWRIEEFIIPTFHPLTIWPGRVVLLLLLTGSIAGLLFYKREKTRPVDLLLWSATAVVMVSFFAVLQRTGTSLMEARHMVTLFWPLTLSVVAMIRRAAGVRAVMAWMLVSLLFYLTSLVAIYRPLAKSGDWRRVAQWISQHEEPGETIAVFRAFGAMSVKLYYDGENPVVQLPDETPVDKYRPADYGFRDEQEVAAALTERENAQGRLWLVSNPDSQCTAMGIDLNCHLLEQYIAGHYQVVRERMFYGSRVRLLQRRTR